MPTKPARGTCFVIMPFGDKTVDGVEYHFDDIYNNFIKATVSSMNIDCVRCDEIGESGWIHTKMFTHIYDADVAVVDITSLNANVFYELGVRHALKKNVTVIIRQAGTKLPFNISGFTVIEYKSDDPVSLKDAADKIKEMIESGLAKVNNIDSPVHTVLKSLKVDNKQYIKKTDTVLFSLEKYPEKKIGIVTGDLQNVKDIDVWVNSENTNMQMARPYEISISGVIRYMGATKSKAGKIKVDTIADELKAALEGETSVDPGCILYTSSGELLETNGVKRILHAASVVGQVGRGYSPIEELSECVRNSLETLDDPKKLAGENLKSILFPLMGTGTSNKNPQDAAEDLVNAAISYFEENKGKSNVEAVYFLAFSKQDLVLCQRIMGSHESLCTTEEKA
ncbi:MAG: macro domain-containing protein [Anaerolineales bacterium]